MTTYRQYAAITAHQAGLVGCTHCAKVWPKGVSHCGRCGQRLSGRDERSLSRVWAWLFAGMLAYIPANIYPMLVTRTLFGTTESTIIGGAVDLALHGSYAVALVILFASVAIPISKFVAIAFLALSVQRRWPGPALRRMQLYELIEFIGRWSMIDVFVVAILVALVQLSVVVSINPGPASLAFALSVIFTMLSARSFDSRMIWDSVADLDTRRPKSTPVPSHVLDLAPLKRSESGEVAAPSALEPSTATAADASADEAPPPRPSVRNSAAT